MTITDGNGCTSSCNKTVTVSPNPPCTITGNSSICQGSSTSLCVDPGAGAYIWSNGATNNCISVSTAGNYSVTITDGNGCTSSCSKSLVLRNLPVCAITGPNSFCEGSITELCAIEGNYSYLWNTGVSTRCIFVNQAGSYAVTIVDEYGCMSSCNKTITSNPIPLCEISGYEVICEGSSNQLCVPAGYEDYWWEDAQQTNCIDGTVPGTYAITITSSNGCKSSCSKNVSISPPTENCIITGNTTICENDVVILCAIEYQENYLWSNGETTQCIAITTAGEYSVTVSQNSECITFCSVTVTSPQNSEPIHIFALEPTVFCQGDSVTLYANQLGVWNTGDTSTTITVESEGLYFITDTNRCGTNISNEILVTVLQNPSSSTISNILPTTFCEGDSVTLYGNSNGTWNTGDTSATIIVKTSGSYYVSNENECGTILSNVIIVNVIPLPLIPTIQALSSTTFCEGQSTILSGNIDGTWNTGETSESIEVSTSGNYFVMNTNECDTTKSNIITVLILPLAEASTIFALEPTKFCQGGSVILYGNTGGIWNTGDTTSSISVNSTGNYFVTNTNTCGNKVSNPINIIVYDAPQCYISGNLNPNKGETITLCAPERIHSYKWNTLEETRCISVTESGERSVIVTNDNICVDSCTVQVVFSDITSLEEENGTNDLLKLNIYPNPFYNDAIIEFKHSFSGQEVKIDIFNSDTKKVVQMNFDRSLSGHWNKITLVGSDLAAGIYMVRLTSGKDYIYKKLILIK